MGGFKDQMIEQMQAQAEADLESYVHSVHELRPSAQAKGFACRFSAHDPVGDRGPHIAEFTKKDDPGYRRVFLVGDVVTVQGCTFKIERFLGPDHDPAVNACVTSGPIDFYLILPAPLLMDWIQHTYRVPSIVENGPDKERGRSRQVVERRTHAGVYVPCQLLRDLFPGTGGPLLLNRSERGWTEVEYKGVWYRWTHAPGDSVRLEQKDDHILCKAVTPPQGEAVPVVGANLVLMLCRDLREALARKLEAAEAVELLRASLWKETLNGNLPPREFSELVDSILDIQSASKEQQQAFIAQHIEGYEAPAAGGAD